ncbi:myocilin isoform X2 [Engraulis encrasicolus]|uniref:myocilin isoform X2 n=1 Tax=Engraulis encrasicolus TaxID=184585 RepID=UPI002FD71DFB
MLRAAFPVLFCFCCVLLGGPGALAQAPDRDRASMWRGNDRGGRCQYTFTVASPSETSCPPSSSSSSSSSSSPLGPGGAEMDSLGSRLSLLETLVTRLVGGEIAGAGGPGTRPLGPGTGTGPRTGPGTGPVSPPQQEAHRQEAYRQAVAEKSQLQREKEALDRQVQELRRRLEEAQQEVQMLRSRPCMAPPPPPPPAAVQDGSGGLRPLAAGGAGGAGGRGGAGGAGGRGASAGLSHLVSSGQTGGLRDPTWSYGGSPGYQELKAEVTEVPAPTPEDTADHSTGCGELVSIGDPVTHRKADTIAGKYGVWMQDPEATPPYGGSMVWRIDTVGSDVRQLFGYEDMDQLSRGYPTKVLLLPEAVESTGAVMFRGSLYYQRRRSRTLLRYDLASESIAARRDLPHAGFHGQFPYSWGGYTDIDLAVDQQGLWAIYSTNKAKGAIVVAKLDPHSLEVVRTWETNIRKVTVANAFMICGRLYTVASYAAPETTVNYVFDTATGKGSAVAVALKNKYRYNSMVDYNPVQKRLFAWDNYHIVSYDVTLGSRGQQRA